LDRIVGTWIERVVCGAHEAKSLALRHDTLLTKRVFGELCVLPMPWNSSSMSAHDTSTDGRTRGLSHD
jgi:hypothetical protein